MKPFCHYRDSIYSRICGTTGRIQLEAVEEASWSTLRQVWKFYLDWTAMREEMGDWDWRGSMEGLNGKSAWEVLKLKIHDMTSRHVPMGVRKTHKRPAWLSREILRAVRRKKRLWKRAKLGYQVEEYREEEKRVKRLIKNAKRGLEKRLADGAGKDGVQKRKFYSYIKQRTKSRPTIGPLKDGGQVVREDKDMARVLNNYFSSVFAREDMEEIPEPRAETIGKELREIKITTKKVQDKIKNLREGAACGPDKIGPRLLKELIDVVASPLALAMRRTLEDGEVPEDWRTANVTPIFKKGPKSAPANYRPVSLTSVCGKILEAIIKDRITAHLDRYQLIRKSQHGFLRNRSCTSNLLSFLEKITQATDNGEPVDVVFLDFAKAFDKVPIQRLLKKVKSHGIGGQLLAWIKAWLTDRKQRVVLNGEASDWARVLSGVPQGSVLGPLLFLIFINDLDEEAALVEILKKFADDTKVAQPIRSEQDRTRLQAVLDNLVSWADTWGMSFNVKKCKVMHVGRSNPRYAYRMGGVELDSTEEERDLGVIMTSKLKPTKQCEKAAKMAQTVLSQIARSFHYKDRHVFVKLYKSYVRPHLEFAVQAWSPWTVGDKDTLEKVQRRAIKMVTGLKGATYEDRLAELGMTTLEERRHQADMAMTHKILTKKVGGEPAEWFTLAGEAVRVTRTASDPLNVRIKHGRLDVRSNFFSVRVCEPWNNVPSDLKKLQPNGFKNAYAEHRK